MSGIREPWEESLKDTMDSAKEYIKRLEELLMSVQAAEQQVCVTCNFYFLYFWIQFCYFFKSTFFLFHITALKWYSCFYYDDLITG